MFRLRIAAISAALFALPMPTPAQAYDYSAGDLRIAHPWSRATPPAAKVGGGYLKIDNRGSSADRLRSVTLDRAGRVEIHEMSIAEGIMRMRELPMGVEIPAGGSVELKPGGLHVMFMDLKSPLKQGDRLMGTLIFERAGAVAVEFAVEAIGASPAHPH